VVHDTGMERVGVRVGDEGDLGKDLEKDRQGCAVSYGGIVVVKHKWREPEGRKWEGESEGIGQRARRRGACGGGTAALMRGVCVLERSISQ
jgi:hypothetical protein